MSSEHAVGADAAYAEVVPASAATRKARVAEATSLEARTSAVEHRPDDVAAVVLEVGVRITAKSADASASAVAQGGALAAVTLVEEDATSSGQRADSPSSSRRPVRRRRRRRSRARVTPRAAASSASTIARLPRLGPRCQTGIRIGQPGAADAAESTIALMHVVVLTTSYPRDERDVAGALRPRRGRARCGRAGVEVDVVSPASSSATSASRTGTGSSATCGAQPWLALAAAALPRSRSRARRGARPADADLVHAHWLPSGLAALATGKPFVVQLWGTDVELARRAPWLVRPILRRARLAIVASEYLAERGAGARRATRCA